MVKDLKAATEINEMDDRFPTEIQRDGICDSVDEESIVNNQQAKPYVETPKANIAEPYAHKLFDDMPRSLSIELKEEDRDPDGSGNCDEQHPDEEIQSNDSTIKNAEDGNHFTDKLLPNSFVKYEETELNGGKDCVVLCKMDAQIDADKVFVETTEPVLEGDFLGIEATKATHCMFHDRTMLSPVHSNADLYEENVPLSSFSYPIELSIGDNGSHWVSWQLANIFKGSAQDLSYEDGVLGDDVTKFPPLPKLEFNPRVFDPGTLKISKQEEYKSQLVIFYVFGEKMHLEANDVGIFFDPVWLLLINIIILSKCHISMLEKENYDPDVAEVFELNGILIEMPELVTTTQQWFCVNDVVLNKFENKMLVGEEQTLFMKMLYLKIGCNNRISFDIGLIMSMFSTQVVIKKFPTSESEMGIEFEKWHSHLVVGNCCRLFDPGGALKTNKYELLFLVWNRENNNKLSVSMINKVSGHNIRSVMLVSFWHYISVLLLDGQGVFKAYKKSNVASDAFGILEYFVDTTMIIVFAMFVDFVWDPGQDNISFYIIEGNDVLKSKGIGIQLALAYSLLEWSFYTLLLITSPKFGIRNLFSLMELFVSSVGCDSIDPNGVKQDAECWKTLHIISLNGATSCAVDIVLKSEPNGGNDVKIVSPIAACEVLDDFPKLLFIPTAGYKLIRNGSDVYSWLNSRAESTLKLDQSIKSVFAGLKPFLAGFQYMYRAKEFVLAELGMLKVSYQVFEEIPELNPIGPSEKRNGNDDPIPLIDYVPQVFDPGTSISFGTYNELFQPSVIYATWSKSISGQCHSLATFLGQCKAVLSFTSNGMVFIFDPGGCGGIVWFLIKGVFCSLYCQSHECLVMCMGSHITSLADMRNDMGNECNLSSVLPTWHDDTHLSCLVEFSRDPVTANAPLYLDEVCFLVRTGNYHMPMSSVDWFKATFFWFEVSCRVDRVAMQMAQMLSPIGYNGFYYCMGSYNITALENACHMNSYQISIVVHTNVVRSDAMSKIFVWYPSVYHFTTLRTRRFLRGWSCHELRSKIRNNTEDASVAVNYQLLAVICDILFSCDVIALHMSYFIILSISTYYLSVYGLYKLGVFTMLIMMNDK